MLLAPGSSLSNIVFHRVVVADVEAGQDERRSLAPWCSVAGSGRSSLRLALRRPSRSASLCTDALTHARPGVATGQRVRFRCAPTPRSPPRRRCSSRAATRRSRRPTATRRCRPTSPRCRAGSATSGAASTRSSCAPCPTCSKAVKWNSPFYGIEGQGWFLSFHCFTKYVKVAFFRGASLQPVPPGESKQQGRALPRHPRGRRARRGAAGELDQAGGRAARLGSVTSHSG